MKKILVAGEHSYIGTSFKNYMLDYPDEYSVDMKNTRNWHPTPEDFEGYDVVLNTAGIAHRRETAENRHLYYEVNRDLAINMAKAAKECGITQFVQLSTMSVYGMREGYITKTTNVKPTSAYGKSKAEADEAIKALADGTFLFACLRPPMVYGKGCKGNYQLLRKLVLKSPVFPAFKNQRSMIYIDNLCIFIKWVIDSKGDGI